jgi:cholesterol transport system auxiliary component
MKCKSLLAVILALPLASCAGGLFKSKLDPASAYVLSARGEPAGLGAPPVPVDLAILKPRMEPGLETDRIAALYPDRRLEFFAGGHWSGSLDDVLQALAVQAFRRQTTLRSVSGESTRFNSTHWLELNVEDFQAEYHTAGAPPIIKVRLVARLGNASDHGLLGRYQAEAEQPATADRLGAIVEAFETAANAALGQIIASTVADTGSARAESR